MAQLFLKGIAYGADKIPDKVFDSIPGGYFRTKQEREERKKDRARRRRNTAPQEEDDYYSDYYTSGDEDRYRTSSRRPRKDSHHKRSQSMNYDNDKRRSGGRYEDRYDDRYSDRYNQNWGRDRNDPFEEPNSPSRAREYVPPAYNPADPYAPKPYNPGQYTHPNGVAAATAAGAAAGAGAGAGATAAYYDGYYQPNGVQPGQQVPNYAPSQASSDRRESTAEMRYRPANYPQPSPSITGSVSNGYVPYQDVYAPPAAPNYTPPQSATNPPAGDPYYYNQETQRGQPGKSLTAPPLDRKTSHSQPPSRTDSRRGRNKSKGRTSSMPRSISGIRGRLSNMDDKDRKLAASAVGALAGGLVAHEMADNTVGTIVGAAIGGMALREWEKKQAKDKDIKSFNNQVDDSYPSDASYNSSVERRRRRRRSRRGSDSDSY